jgi:glucarate dehydratase
MEIREMEVTPVAHREPPLRNSWGVHSDVEARTIVRLTTADGLVGVGETYGNDAVLSELEGAVDTVEGSDPYETTRLELRLQGGRGRGEESGQAYGAIETALLDLRGKAVGEPVHKLLGGAVRDAVPYSGYLFYKHADPEPESAAIAPQEVMTPKAMVEEAREFVDEHGFETLKLKGGVLEPDQEIRTLELLAEEFPDAPLRIDPNGNWSVSTAIDIARSLRERDLNVQFLEDPVPTMRGHARLKKHIDYPIATNMYVTSFEEIPPAVELDAVDVILSDHHYWGGLTNTVELDRIVRTFDLGVGMHSNSHLGVSMAAMTHVGAAMPTLRYACDTHYPWESDDVIEDAPLEFENGAIPVPDDPGLGVELDDDAVDRMHQRYQEHEPERDDASTLVEQEGDWIPNNPRW